MNITIETGYVTIKNSEGFDGSYRYRLITTDHCFVLPVTESPRQFVLKFLQSGYPNLPEENLLRWRNSFGEEKRRLSGLCSLPKEVSRPLVPEIYSFDPEAHIVNDIIGTDYVSPLIVMEYVVGIKFDCLGDRFPGYFFTDLCYSLKHFNDRDFFHMDLREPNLIVDSAGHVWLIDFTGSFIENLRNIVLKADDPLTLLCERMSAFMEQNPDWFGGYYDE